MFIRRGRPNTFGKIVYIYIYIYIQYIIYIIIHLHIEYFKVSSFSLHSTAGSGDIESLPKVWGISVLFWQTFKQWQPFLWNSFVVSALKLNVHIHQSSPGNLSMNNQPGTPRRWWRNGWQLPQPISEWKCMYSFSIGSFVLNTATSVIQTTFLSCSILQTWQWACERTAQELRFSPCSAKKQDLLKTALWFSAHFVFGELLWITVTSS